MAKKKNTKPQLPKVGMMVFNNFLIDVHGLEPSGSVKESNEN